MRWALLAILGVTGCDKLFTLPHIEALPPDAPGIACPPDYVAIEGLTSKYRWVPIDRLWEDANADCMNDLVGSTHLVVLDTLAELEAMRTLVVGKTNYNLHVGYARDTVAAGGDANIFYSVTGDLLVRGMPAWDLWEMAEPNNFNGIETIVFMEDDALMRDGEPTRMDTFVCECDGRPVTKTFTLY